MSNEDDFILRWEEHEQFRTSSLQSLWKNKDFLNVTIACDDDQIEAHKVILSAASPFFRDILKRNPHSHPLLYLRGTRKKDVEALLEFVYSGITHVIEEELEEFLAMATSLQVQGLCRDFPGLNEGKFEESTEESAPNEEKIETNRPVIKEKKQPRKIKQKKPRQNDPADNDFNEDGSHTLKVSGRSEQKYMQDEKQGIAPENEYYNHSGVENKSNSEDYFDTATKHIVSETYEQNYMEIEKQHGIVEGKMNRHILPEEQAFYDTFQRLDNINDKGAFYTNTQHKVSGKYGQKKSLKKKSMLNKVLVSEPPYTEVNISMSENDDKVVNQILDRYGQSDEEENTQNRKTVSVEENVYNQSWFVSENNDKDASEAVTKKNLSESFEQNESYKNQNMLNKVLVSEPPYSELNTSMSEYAERVAELVKKTEAGWTCLKCPYEKKNSGHVREHVESHITGFSFSCGYCDKTFSNKRTLRHHERNCLVSKSVIKLEKTNVF